MHADVISVDGKLTSGEPRIDLDSPDVSGSRRTATSEVWNGKSGSTAFGGLASAEMQHLLAGWRGGARYATATPSSAISLNYATPRGTSERTTVGRATPAIKRLLLAEERGDARYATSAPSSAISENYGPEKVTRVVATAREERPFLARKREEARHAASAPSSGIAQLRCVKMRPGARKAQAGGTHHLWRSSAG